MKKAVIAPGSCAGHATVEPARTRFPSQIMEMQIEKPEGDMARVKLVGRTDNTITSVAKLRKAIAQVRKADFALLDQELEVGLRSIAVPVRDARGNVVAAINVGTHASRFSLAELESRCLPPLRHCAAELARMLLG